MGRLPSLQTKGYNDNQKQWRIQTLFEIGNRFSVHENRRPHFARSTKDIILILFNSSQIDLNNETQI